MSLVIKLCYQFLHGLDAKYKDKRSENLFLLGSPLPVLAISLFYYFFVKKLGPSLMKNRQAYELKYVLMIYNLFQVFANLGFVYMATELFYVHKKFSEWNCMYTDRSTSSYGITVVRLAHLYYLLKIIDYFDTIFFVLRKRYDQITFLHVYHHFGMVVSCYIAVSYIGGGQVFIVGYLNTFVHAVMYFYYFMSAIRPAMKNSLWWKKYITQLQLVQFALNMIHFSAALLRKDCAQPKLLMLYSLVQNLFMTLMFTDFYIKAYIKKPKLKMKKM